jgi:hypothetical protein
MHVLASIVAVFLSLCPIHAAVVFNESINGPLSFTGTSPTQIPLNLGANSIVSTFGGSTQFDYFSFTLATGQSLTSFRLDSYVSADAVAWLGIKRGSDWTINYDRTQMLAQQHFGTANICSDILGISTSSPLVAGTYTVRSQQLGATANYQVTLNVIPEPSSLSLLLLSLGALSLHRRRH